MEKELTVKGRNYKRTIKTKPITFWCKFATEDAPEGHKVTEERFPGPTPDSCLAHKEAYRKQQNARRTLAAYHHKKTDSHNQD